MKSMLSNALFLFLCTCCYGQQETEPNGTTSSATPMGAIITGTINPAGDVDIFSFQVNQPGVLSMRVSNVPSNLALTIHMLDPDLLQWITVSSVVAGNSVGFDWNACKMGKYYIRIFQPQNNFSASPYTVTASLNIDDIYECNNSFDEAKSLVLNQSVNAYINSEGDRDYFLMDFPSAGQLNLNVPTLPGNMRMVLYVYDFARNLVKKTNVPVSSGTPVSMQTTIAAGKHYIVVEDDNYNMSTTKYTLNTSFSPSTGLTDFQREYNNKIKVSPNPSVGKFTISIDQSPILKPQKITLYNGMGVKVYEKIITESSNYYLIEQDNLPAGTYYLKLNFAKGEIGKLISIYR